MPPHGLEQHVRSEKSVRKNCSGSKIERSTCDSAAKLTMRRYRASHERSLDGVRIADVAAQERIARIVCDIGDVRWVCRIRHRVEIEDRDPRSLLSVMRMKWEPMKPRPPVTSKVATGSPL